jgi:hypothetical protein
VVERQLPKLNVAGSNPVSRSKQKSRKASNHAAFRDFYFTRVGKFAKGTRTCKYERTLTH